MHNDIKEGLGYLVVNLILILIHGIPILLIWYVSEQCKIKSNQEIEEFNKIEIIDCGYHPDTQETMLLTNKGMVIYTKRNNLLSWYLYPTYNTLYDTMPSTKTEVLNKRVDEYKEMRKIEQRPVCVWSYQDIQKLLKKNV